MAINYDITQGLFGDIMGLQTTPEEQRAKYMQGRDASAYRMAGLEPGRTAVAAGGMLAQDLGQNVERLGGGIRRNLLGIETQGEQEDQIVKQLQSQAAQISQSQGLEAAVTFLEQEYSKAGLTQKAMKASQLKQQIKERNLMTSAELAKLKSEEKRNIAQAEAAGKKKPIQVDLGDRIEFRDPDTYAVIETVKKGMTPEQKAKSEAAAGEQKEGFIGKTGAYRNKYGEVIPGPEMSKQRKGFQAGEELLQKLNKIEYSDVVNAKSVFDYSAGGELKKGIGSKLDPKTVAAQTKIAAAQLLQQINSLPPGSASDADMRQAAKEFPGFGDIDTLTSWVNRTKESLQSSLERQSDQYGFNQRIKSTGDIGKGNKKQEQAQQPKKRKTASGVEYEVEE